MPEGVSIPEGGSALGSDASGWEPEAEAEASTALEGKVDCNDRAALESKGECSDGAEEDGSSESEDEPAPTGAAVEEAEEAEEAETAVEEEAVAEEEEAVAATEEDAVAAEGAEEEASAERGAGDGWVAQGEADAMVESGVAADVGPPRPTPPPQRAASVSLRDEVLAELQAAADAPAVPVARSGAELRGLFGARHSGLLQKRGLSSLSRWKTRWFALHDDVLCYYSRAPVLPKPSFAAPLASATLRLHRPRQGDPPHATTLSWALGDGRAVFLRAPPHALKQWLGACHALRLPVEHNFAV